MFRPYAPHWVRAILQVANHAFKDEKGFNYYLRDICILFLQWGTVPREHTEEKTLASGFINHLVKNAVYANKEITRSNLEILKLLVELWRGTIRFSKVKKLSNSSQRHILNFITNDGPLYQLTGLQILGVFGASFLSSHDSGKWICSL